MTPAAQPARRQPTGLRNIPGTVARFPPGRACANLASRHAPGIVTDLAPSAHTPVVLLSAPHALNKLHADVGPPHRCPQHVLPSHAALHSQLAHAHSDERNLEKAPQEIDTAYWL